MSHRVPPTEAQPRAANPACALTSVLRLYLTVHVCPKKRAQHTAALSKRVAAGQQRTGGGLRHGVLYLLQQSRAVVALWSASSRRLSGPYVHATTRYAGRVGRNLASLCSF